MKRQRASPIRDFPGKRWLNVSLRAVHVAGLILLGASLLAHSGESGFAVLLTVTSGLIMFLIDTWVNPDQLREVAGLGILLKLGVIGLMIWQPNLALELFWGLVVLSTVLSHAPAHFRHRRLL